MEPAMVRIRTVFEDRKMLNKSQRSSGLKRSWFLLRPEHEAISDLASYLIQAFELGNSCPNGIILSMDGYVLPPFESTRILKDKDIISVSKKRGLSDMIELGDVENSLELEIVDKQPAHAGLKLLAIEEFKKGIGGYESELEEDEADLSEDAPEVEITPAKSKASKKRKASKEPQIPKSKKSKRSTIEEHLVDENGILEKHSKRSRHDRVLSRKKLAKKDKSCLAQGEQDELNVTGVEERSNDSSKSSSDMKRSCCPDENDKEHEGASQTPVETGKVPSRSARRKKAKRQWLRLNNQEKKELQEKQTFNQDHQQSLDKESVIFSKTHQEPGQNNDAPCKAVQVFSDKHQKSNQNGDAEEHYVPVVIRPGHIRFKPLGEDDDDIEQNNQTPEDTFQWNGITSKRKGQKWGMEKHSSSKRSDYRNPSPESPESSEKVIDEEGLSANGPLDFDKLAPYTTMPKEGDVIAYRLIELSSSWTPELSSFRVGKISRYDPGPNNILLAPVPEYPIVFEKEMDEEGSELQPDTSLYAEDGTLEINFLSLVEIRSVKLGNLDPVQAVTGAVNGIPVKVGNAQPDHNANANANANAKSDRTHVPAQENGDVWEQLSQALSAKKAQLSREEGGSSKKENSGRRPSSFRGLRSSALGPTMSILRAQNKL